MAGKKLYDAMVAELEGLLDGNTFDLLSFEQGVKKNEDGSQTPFTKVEVEIPKGNGAFSRCRFSCKLPPIQLQVSEEEIDDGVSVTLVGVQVTFISSQKEIYTKAESIQRV
ncbi:hypothetical protein [Mediterraneibacter gnavus]|uniref:hypothetical protein n=1 Tax=Mediterraneibacter gnavus TaxID=33038 RepID=UPI000E46D186|nr:hypothetical protein [Mediterraneibacter gnavus]RHB98804.1 hypothetical protein DW865_04065 [Mediterraneibacter gnavus]